MAILMASLSYFVLLGRGGRGGFPILMGYGRQIQYFGQTVQYLNDRQSFRLFPVGQNSTGTLELADVDLV